MKKKIWASFGRLFLFIFNKIIIFKAKKDSFLKTFVDNFNASIQITTKDDLVNGYILFKGKDGIEYSEGKLKNPDSIVIYRSVKDLFIFCINYANINEALIENRFDMFGNLNILFKYGFLANYINPTVKKLKIKKNSKKKRIFKAVEYEGLDRIPIFGASINNLKSCNYFRTKHQIKGAIEKN